MNGATKTSLQVVRDSWERAKKVQDGRNAIYTRLWQRYKGYNPGIINPNRPNLVMPKLYTAIETLVPRISKALFGRRPYIPIKSEKNPMAVEPIEMALDAYLYKDRFKIKGAQALKVVALFGTAFLEPMPVQEMVTERRFENGAMVDEQIPRFRLKTRQYMPWQVYVEPHMMSLDDPGYAIIVEIVAKSEILRLMGTGRYPKADLEKFNSSAKDQEALMDREMMLALNITQPEEDDSYGVLMRYMDNEQRYITTWNGYCLLEDYDNPYSHRKINLVRFVWNQDPMLQNSFWGQPEGKAIEPILDKLDESWNMTLMNGDILTQAVIAYREKAVNPERIIFAGGARIPIKANFDGNVNEAIGVLQTGGLPTDAYRIPAILDMECDRGVGIHSPQRGEPSGDRQTATESSLLYTQGDLRNEHRAEVLEALGLAAFADLATSHIDQFAAFDDLVEVIGEHALGVQTMNPNMIAGGFNYEFKGSDSIQHDFARKAEGREVVQNLANSQALRPGGLERWQLDREGLTPAEINRIILTDEELAQMAQAQQQMADEERLKDLANDVVLAQAEGDVKARVAAAKPKGVGDKPKPRGAAKQPTMNRPAGTR